MAGLMEAAPFPLRDNINNDPHWWVSGMGYEEAIRGNDETIRRMSDVQVEEDEHFTEEDFNREFQGALREFLAAGSDEEEADKNKVRLIEETKESKKTKESETTKESKL